MPSPTTISIDKLARLFGTPGCPSLIDVRTDEDFSADPRLLPGSIRRPHASVPDWSGKLEASSAIVICQKGRKLSEGVAAWLRCGGGKVSGAGADRLIDPPFCRMAQPAPDRP